MSFHNGKVLTYLSYEALRVTELRESAEARTLGSIGGGRIG